MKIETLTLYLHNATAGSNQTAVAGTVPFDCILVGVLSSVAFFVDSALTTEAVVELNLARANTEAGGMPTLQQTRLIIDRAYLHFTAASTPAYVNNGTTFVPHFQQLSKQQQLFINWTLNSSGGQLSVDYLLLMERREEARGQTQSRTNVNLLR